ncbi:hypothetical protein CP8484711_1137A, partial [Chlamydia psittaci 84-8471/1]
MSLEQLFFYINCKESVKIEDIE